MPTREPGAADLQRGPTGLRMAVVHVGRTIVLPTGRAVWRALERRLGDGVEAPMTILMIVSWLVFGFIVGLIARAMRPTMNPNTNQLTIIKMVIGASTPSPRRRSSARQTARPVGSTIVRPTWTTAMRRPVGPRCRSAAPGSRVGIRAENAVANAVDAMRTCPSCGEIYAI